MENRPLPRPKIRATVRRVPQPKAVTQKDFLTLAELPGTVAAWIDDSRAAGHSVSRIENVSGIMSRLLWYMEREQIVRFDAACIRRFLTYLRTAHDLPEGRWGEKGETRESHQNKKGRGVSVSMRYRENSPSTIETYHRAICAFGNWARIVGLVDVSPLATVKKPVNRTDSEPPRVFTRDEINKIFAHAKKTKHAKRDYAICLFLLDTGVRASELCALTWADVQPSAKCARVVKGKGGKSRDVHWESATARALLTYSAEWEIDPHGPVFFSQGGSTTGEALTRSGLLQIVDGIGRAAGVDGCHPHAFRHTYATMYIVNGGQQFALMRLMGHSNIKQTQQYVDIANADLATQARTYSPVASLKKARTGQTNV